MLRRDSPTPREHMSERLWMRNRMTLLYSVCHHHEFVKTSHRGSHETCSPQVLTEPRTSLVQRKRRIKCLGGFKFGRKHRSHALIEVVDGKDVQTIVRGGAGAN